jgi:membrane fusion protein (multidrug efflux system)
MRALQADRLRFRVGLVLGVVAAGWLAWFLFGEVAVYEVSDRARLEVNQASLAVAAPVAGRVLESRLTLGRQVQAGDILVVLDAQAERLALAEMRTRRATLAARQDAVRSQIVREQETLRLQQEARGAARAEAQADIAGALARHQGALEEAQMLVKLRPSRAVSELEILKSRANAEAAQAAHAGLVAAAARREQDRLAEEGERRAKVSRLQRDVVDLESEAEIADAATRKLKHEIDLRTVRAPVSGQIGESAIMAAGAVVRPGEQLAAIIPSGPARIVAHFPMAAVGRLQMGQSARLRLDGFPWTQYGTLAATVAEVGNEAREGLIRVELTLTEQEVSTIPVGHGLAGAVEVEIEIVTPATLVLRAAGQFLGSNIRKGGRES